MGKDHTIFSKVEGLVKFTRKRNDRNYISVIPFEDDTVTTAATRPAPAVEAAVAAPVIDQVVDAVEETDIRTEDTVEAATPVVDEVVDKTESLKEETMNALTEETPTDSVSDSTGEEE